MVTLMAVAQLMEGIRTLNCREGKPIWQDWKERNFLTSTEGKYIKMAHTYMLKFFEEVFKRIDETEKDKLLKQLIKFDIRIMDAFTLEKLDRDIKNRMINAAVPRQQFENWCEEIMLINCKDCTKDSCKCNLREIFEDNFVPDGGFTLPNCRYAYTLPVKEVKHE